MSHNVCHFDIPTIFNEIISNSCDCMFNHYFVFESKVLLSNI